MVIAAVLAVAIPTTIWAQAGSSPDSLAVVRRELTARYADNEAGFF